MLMCACFTYECVCGVMFCLLHLSVCVVMYACCTSVQVRVCGDAKFPTNPNLVKTSQTATTKQNLPPSADRSKKGKIQMWQFYPFFFIFQIWKFYPKMMFFSTSSLLFNLCLSLVYLSSKMCFFRVLCIFAPKRVFFQLNFDYFLFVCISWNIKPLIWVECPVKVFLPYLEAHLTPNMVLSVQIWYYLYWGGVSFFGSV